MMTPDLVQSGIVRQVELTRLPALDADLAFVLAIANEVRTDEGKTDYDAPDRLLGEPNGTLSTIKQYPVGGRSDLVPIVQAPLDLSCQALRGRTPRVCSAAAASEHAVPRCCA